jgi:hypothetical protein
VTSVSAWAKSTTNVLKLSATEVGVFSAVCAIVSGVFLGGAAVEKALSVVPSRDG